MTVPIRGLLSLLLAVAIPTTIAAQTLEGLPGNWALDRPASTFGPGDPGADRVEIVMSPTDVGVRRFFFGALEPSVWTLALDGSAPPPPKRGSALVIDGRLVITHERAQEVVTHVYTVEGDTLSVERSIRARSPNGDAAPLTHVMVFRRVT
jgi:hypothetical protein